MDGSDGDRKSKVSGVWQGGGNMDDSHQQCPDNHVVAANILCLASSHRL